MNKIKIGKHYELKKNIPTNVVMFVLDLKCNKPEVRTASSIV